MRAGLQPSIDMPELALTERQLREREYYEEYVKRNPPAAASMRIIDGDRRPWNPYWYVAELVMNRAAGPTTRRLLDFGCGCGMYAVLFARIGYDVSGFDVSPSNVGRAEQLAAASHVADRCRFSVGVAERLDYPTGHFDVVVGIDILHHVDIRPAVMECLRVLKGGGVAIFKEPIAAPVFDRVRNSWIGRALRPTDASFERHVTSDERKLTAADLRLIRSLCRTDERRFRVLSRLEGLMTNPWVTKHGSSWLEIMDYHLLRVCPPLRVFGGNIVLVCHR